MQWMDDTTLQSGGQASRVNAPEDGFGSKSVIRRCRLRCPVCPKAGTAGLMSTRPNPPLVPTLQLPGGSSILGWDLLTVNPSAVSSGEIVAEAPHEAVLL